MAQYIVTTTRVPIYDKSMELNVLGIGDLKSDPLDDSIIDILNLIDDYLLYLFKSSGKVFITDGNSFGYAQLSDGGFINMRYCYAVIDLPDHVTEPKDFLKAKLALLT